MKKTICDFCGKEFDLWDIDVNLCTDCFNKMMDEYILPRCKNKVVKIPDDR